MSKKEFLIKIETRKFRIRNIKGENSGTYGEESVSREFKTQREY